MFSEDLSLFFNANDFAVTVNIDGLANVNGIFEEQYIEVNYVQTKKPIFTFASADYLVTLDSILVNGLEVFKVKGIEPDGSGITRLILEKQDG